LGSRRGLWKKAHEDEDAFWDGKIIKLPEDDWHSFRGKPYSYFALLMEEPVLEEVWTGTALDLLNLQTSNIAVRL